MGACCSNPTDPNTEISMNQPVKNTTDIFVMHTKHIIKI